ncbi:MAG: hypothetical protein ACLFWB_09365 [Armatimonadota bacterium]
MVRCIDQMMAVSQVSILAPVLFCALLPVFVGAQTVPAQTRDLGDGFRDHGPFSRVAENRGMVCTEDGEGRSVILVWLFDHRYAYALGVIDAVTGEIEEIPRPISSDCPFASILGSNGRYYTYFGGHFMEFDPHKREFTVVQRGPDDARRARSMTEDDSGVIWAALSPNSDVVSYNPRTGEFREYGSVNKHPSRQFPQHIAADDSGWIYVGIGLAAGQLVMLNPDTGEASPVVPEHEIVGTSQSVRGRHPVYRDRNGKVYGHTLLQDGSKQWYELYEGEATKLDEEPDIDHRPIIAGSQGLRHRKLPNGERVRELDLIEGRLIVENPETGEAREMHFELDAEGGAAMGVTATPAGTIAGGTYIPHRFFSYNPTTDEWTMRDCYRQWNTVTATDELVYIGTYTKGEMLEWNPAMPWVPTERDNPESNPRWLPGTYAAPHLGRPYALLAHPDGRHVILGGKPGYGCTGGALTFYDRETDTAQIVTHDELIPWHSTMSLVGLSDGKILGGTTPDPSNGGVRKAEGDAELYILDLETKEIQWHEAVVEGAGRYDDMIMGPDGKVFGIIDRTRLFVFDPVEKAIVHLADLEEDFGSTVYQQGPRIFVNTPDDRILILFTDAIAQLDTDTYEVTMLVETPFGLGQGGAYLDGRLYFAAGPHGAHLYSWEVPPME